MPARPVNLDHYQTDKLIRKRQRPAAIGKAGILKFYDGTQPPSCQTSDLAEIPQVTDAVLAEIRDEEPGPEAIDAVARIVEAMHARRDELMRAMHQGKRWGGT